MASITCAHCKATHTSVAEVRECAAVGTVARNLGGTKVAYSVETAEAEMHRMEAAADRAESLAASAAKAAKWDAEERGTYRPGTSAPLSTIEKAVPAGRYAVTEGGVLKFFVIDKPTEGRWKGYTFVKIQASDDTFPVKDRARRTVILSAIAQDPQAASKRYGMEIGKCGVCNRTLTDPDSIAAGIGPVCASKMGW